MKLNPKGCTRLGVYESRGFPISEFTFFPTDFKGGVVILSKDEAMYLAGCCLTLSHDVYFRAKAKEMHGKLCDRIRSIDEEN